MKFAAIVNRASGYVREKSPAYVRAMLENAVPGGLARIRIVDPDDVRAGLEEAFESACDGVVVLGGDGTARAAAEMARLRDTPIIPLPGGTMNFLPHRLYGEREPADALRAALGGELRRIDCGLAEDRLFFLSAAFGLAPDITRAREAFRGQTALDALPEMFGFARRAFSGAFRTNVVFGMDGDDAGRRAEMLILAVGALSDLGRPGPAERPEPRAFECVAADIRDLGEVARLGLNTLMQRWRDDPSVSVERAHSLTVRLREDDACGVLDGDPVPLGPEFEVRYIEEAVPVIAPRAGS